MATVHVERQFNNVASQQTSPIWLESYWESRRLPKAAHFGPFQTRWLRQTPKPNTHCQDVLNCAASPLKWMCWTHPTRRAGSSLGSDTQLQFRGSTSISRIHTQFFLVNEVFWVVFGSPNPFPGFQRLNLGSSFLSSSMARGSFS